MRHSTQASRPLRQGDWLDRYEIIRPLARGGMGEIYLARDMDDGAGRVVVKRLPPECIEMRRDSVKMFLDEARIGTSIFHPNIAQIFDFGEDKGSFYLAMEYIEGCNLRQLIKFCRKHRVVIPLPVALHLVLGAAAGLQAAHAACDRQGKNLGIVHRDVSPHNIMVSKDEGAKLIDFGIARSHDKQSQTQTGMVKGKLAYMSPEQSRNRNLDARSDIYSLGLILYELTVGRHPYQGQSASDIAREIGRDSLPDPRVIHPNYPKALFTIIHQMTRVDVRRRYQSASEVISDLTEFAKRSRCTRSSRAVNEWIQTLLQEMSAKPARPPAKIVGQIPISGSRSHRIRASVPASIPQAQQPPMHLTRAAPRALSESDTVVQDVPWFQDVRPRPTCLPSSLPHLSRRATTSS